MKPTQVILGCNLVVTRVLHIDGSGDPTVVMAAPTSKQVFRHSIDIQVKLYADVLDVMTHPEVSVWLNELYKNKTLTADHKTLAMISEELTDAIEDEFATLLIIPVQEITITEGRMTQTFKYE
jgi:hypothetical protein